MKSFDLLILEQLNQWLNNPYVKNLAMFFSSFWAYVVIAVIFIWKIKNHKIKNILAALVLIAGFIGIGDFFTSYGIKFNTNALRPCKIYPWIIKATSCNGKYSFPSNHTTNAFILFTMSSLLLTKYSKITKKIFFFLLIWVTLIGVSRVVLGLHRPSEVLAGAVLGTLFGYYSRWKI